MQTFILYHIDVLPTGDRSGRTRRDETSRSGGKFALPGMTLRTDDDANF